MCNCKKKKPITDLKKEFDALKKKTEDLEIALKNALKKQNQTNNSALYFED
jgi:predicted  nucleic acid-binding Zn-ribbon protein